VGVVRPIHRLGFEFGTMNKISCNENDRFETYNKIVLKKVSLYLPVCLSHCARCVAEKKVKNITKKQFWKPLKAAGRIC